MHDGGQDLLRERNYKHIRQQGQELRLFGKVDKTSWRESIGDLLTHFTTVWH